MKAINANAQTVFNQILSWLNADGYAKIDTAPGSYMPLVVERIGSCHSGVLYSLAHYGEQNGDLMRDPEMTFLVGDDGSAYPMTFRNDYAGYSDESVIFNERGEISGIRPRKQREHADFANTWLRNISEQQDLEAREVAG